MSTTTQIEESVWMDAPPIQESELEMPQWYQDFQKASWDRFKGLPLATRNDENWRYADLKKSRFEKLYPVQSGNVQGTLAEKAAKDRFEDTAAHFVYLNGELIDFDIANLPEGAICAPINAAIEESGDRLKPWLTDRNFLFQGLN